MERPIDINFRAVRVTDEYELVDSPAIAGRIAVPQDSSALRLLTPPVFYSLARGIEDDRAINDALIAAARTLGTRAFGVAEPKFGNAAAAEIERLAALGAAGIVWSPRAQGTFGNDHALAGLIRHAHDHGLVSMIQSAPYSINEGLWRLWSLAELCGDAPLVILGAFESWENIQLVRERKGGGASLFYDISAMAEGHDLDHLVAAMGAERLLLGSGGGDGLAASLAVVERAAIPEEAKQAIRHGNAARLFALAGTPA